MAKTIPILCYYGYTDGRSTRCAATVSLSGGARSETLTLCYMDNCRIALPFRSLEHLAGSVLVNAPRSGTYPTIEKEGVADGFFSDSGMMLRPSKVTMWFRSNGQIDMVTLSDQNSGQVSVPYAPIAGLAQSQRSNLI